MNNNGKVFVDMQFDELSMVISYLFTDNELINYNSVSALRKLFDSIDTRIFEADKDIMARFYFIKEILKAKLDDGIFNYTLLIDGVRGGDYDKEIDDIVEFLETTPELNNEEIDIVHDWLICKSMTIKGE